MATIIQMLMEDHRIITSLFDEYEASRTPEVAMRLGDALVLHACVEEAFLYPLVRTALVGGQRLAYEAEDDHEKVKDFVAEAEDTRGDALDELIFELRYDVDVHMRWEEEDLFPRLAELLDEVTLHDVARRVLAFKRRQPVA
jgi:hemerythrin superfamily protein